MKCYLTLRCATCNRFVMTPRDLDISKNVINIGCTRCSNYVYWFPSTYPNGGTFYTQRIEVKVDKI